MGRNDVKKAYETLLTCVEVNGKVRTHSSVNHSSALFLSQTKGSSVLGKEKRTSFKLTRFINKEYTSGFT